MPSLEKFNLELEGLSSLQCLTASSLAICQSQGLVPAGRSILHILVNVVQAHGEGAPALEDCPRAAWGGDADKASLRSLNSWVL